jgi:carbon storage regulator CsrA
MLVLSRKIDEKVLIGDDIEIVIVAVAGDNVASWHQSTRM